MRERRRSTSYYKKRKREKTMKTTNEVKAEVKTEVKVTDKETRNILASNIFADIEKAVASANNLEFDTTSNLVKRYSFYNAIKYKDSTKKLVNIWSHASFVDLCMTEKTAQAMQEKSPDIFAKARYSVDAAKVACVEIADNDRENIRKLTSSILLAMIAVVQADNKASTESEPKQATAVEKATAKRASKAKKASASK